MKTTKPEKDRVPGVDDCGLCGSADVYSGSWAPSKCRECGAIEGSNDVWYLDKEKGKL